MNFAGLRYKAALRRSLCCSGRTKRRMMAGFQNQLNLLREECPNASAADIWAAFGSPQDMAKTMTYDLPVAERIKYDRLRRCRNIVIALLVALFVALTIYTYCFQEIETFYITEITVIGEEYYTDDPVPTEETVEPTEG